MLGAGRGEGLRSQQPQHETANRGSFRVQRGQWLRGVSMGETFFWSEMRSIEGTGGAQQPLTVLEMMGGEKSNGGHRPKGRNWICPGYGRCPRWERRGKSQLTDCT